MLITIKTPLFFCYIVTKSLFSIKIPKLLTGHPIVIPHHPEGIPLWGIRGRNGL